MQVTCQLIVLKKTVVTDKIPLAETLEIIDVQQSVRPKEADREAAQQELVAVLRGARLVLPEEVKAVSKLQVDPLQQRAVGRRRIVPPNGRMTMVPTMADMTNFPVMSKRIMAITKHTAELT